MESKSVTEIVSNSLLKVATESRDKSDSVSAQLSGIGCLDFIDVVKQRRVIIVAEVDLLIRMCRLVDHSKPCVGTWRWRWRRWAVGRLHPRDRGRGNWTGGRASTTMAMILWHSQSFGRVFFPNNETTDYWVGDRIRRQHAVRPWLTECGLVRIQCSSGHHAE